MEAIGAYDAKTHLPRLLDDVAKDGKTYVITKHGVPVARLVPARTGAAQPEEVVAELRTSRFLGLLARLPITVDLAPVNMSALVAAGRRYDLPAYDAAYPVLAE